MDVNEPQQGQGKMNFRCSDVGPKNCDWQVSGNSEEEIMPRSSSMVVRSTISPLTKKLGTRFAAQSSAKQHNS